MGNYAKDHHGCWRRGHFTWVSRGFHVHKEKARNFIGLAVQGVRKDTKRLPSLFGTVLAHSGVVWGQTKGQGCPSLRP